MRLFRKDRCLNNPLWLLILFTGFLLTGSCSSSGVEESISGLWNIDTAYYKKNDIKNCLYSNVILLKPENQCELPTMGKRCTDVEKTDFVGTGSWEIRSFSPRYDSVPMQLVISSFNNVFSGAHEVRFYRDGKNKLLRMMIRSKNLYIIAHKGLFNYDANAEVMKELEWRSIPAYEKTDTW